MAQASIIDISSIKNFMEFCTTFDHITGSQYTVSTCNEIFYNMMLVLSGHRKAMLVQPIDFHLGKDYAIVMVTIIQCFPQIKTLCHEEGTLVFLKENRDEIETILESSEYNSYAIGQILSYPCYNHEWNPCFASLYVEDKFGKHQLFANWYEDDGTIFYDGVLDMARYLIKNLGCKCYVEFRNRKDMKKIYIE